MGKISIISGAWRHRKITVLDADGLRPTPSRVRETIFNWLMPYIKGAHCLDLFAGSGALGFEALSRGAKEVTMVETNRDLVHELQRSCQLLSADNCLIEHKTAHTFMCTSTSQFDIVFIDPPHQADIWVETANQLVKQGILADHAYIYVECNHHTDLSGLPKSWQLLRDKKAGGVRYSLFAS